VKVTPAILRAGYAYLAETEPFNGWNMPDEDDVKFEVIGAGRAYGWCHYPPDDTKPYKIQISGKYHTHSFTLLKTLAHEMVHIYMHRMNIGHGHGKVFKALAAEVSEAHGFDRGQF
jgi:hypothetical protein